MMFRIGIGFDAHAFADGRRLVLGGARIPHPRGLAGHSDADVLTHAVIDAVLGALGMGDIGGLFPDDDPAHKDADSLALLRQVMAMAAAQGAETVNMDSTIMAQTPLMAPHIAAMRRNLSDCLGAPAERICVKATTTERLGFVGREEGIAAQAVVLLRLQGEGAAE